MSSSTEPAVPRALHTQQQVAADPRPPGDRSATRAATIARIAGIDMIVQLQVTDGAVQV
jgi:hypothetical protein